MEKEVGHCIGLKGKGSVRTLSKCKVKTEIEIKTENKQLGEKDKRLNMYYISFLPLYYICDIYVLLFYISFAYFSWFNHVTIYSIFSYLLFNSSIKFKIYFYNSKNEFYFPNIHV